jgi:glycosyltransferase involved in cell wall biosynthesis
MYCPQQKNLLKERWGIERNVVLFVARLEKRKAPWAVLQAFHETVKTVTDAKLVIIGKGPEESHLRELQKELRLEQVFFLGRLPREEMRFIYPGSDLLVLPSLYEPFGNVLLEAMSSGLPVVGSRIGGIRDIVVHAVTGYQIDPGDSMQLAHYVTKLLVDEKLRCKMSKSARETAERKYDDMVVAQNIARIYLDCLRR